MKKTFITSALPYVNNVPHLGNIIGSVLSGDICSRYKKMMGDNVIFLCGTDDYGTASTIKAMIDGDTCENVCNKYHNIHKEIYDWFNIYFDVWGRTSTSVQTKITHEIFLGLHKNGYITEKALAQMYCEKCELFLADRYIKGICYHDDCRDKNSLANGDQCDQCQRIIDTNLLMNPVCFLCNTQPIFRNSKHLFLSLDKLANVVNNYLENNAQLNNQSMSMAKQGLASSVHYSRFKMGHIDSICQ